MALALASCTDAPVITTTTEDTTTTTTTTTTMPLDERVALQPNAAPFLRQGDRGPYVAALQFYLLCVGIEEPEPGGSVVTVDGSFGPVTALAVAYYQAQLRRVPSGSPDEETFASLARDCDRERSLEFPVGEFSEEVAGHAAPGNDQVFFYEGGDGQVLRLTPVEGAVGIAVYAADGSPVAVAETGERFDAELPGAQLYSIRVSASAPTSFLLLAEVRSPTVITSDFGPMLLRSDGLGVADFGDDPSNTIAIITLLLQAPWEDTDWQTDAPGCTGANRHVTWLIQAASSGDRHPAVLIISLSDVGGERAFAKYSYRSLDLAELDPIAQGLATRDGISIGSTLAEFIEAHGRPSFDDEGRAQFSEGMTVGVDLVDGAVSPDEELSRVWYLAAGSDGCDGP